MNEHFSVFTTTTTTTTTTTPITTTQEKCAIKDAKNIILNEKVFCGKYIGQYDRATGDEKCRKMQTSLPLPRNKLEQIKLLNILQNILAPGNEKNEIIYIDLKETDRQGNFYSYLF